MNEALSMQHHFYAALSEKKVQKLSLGLYLFKRYTFVHFRC